MYFKGLKLNPMFCEYCHNLRTRNLSYKEQNVQLHSHHQVRHMVHHSSRKTRHSMNMCRHNPRPCHNYYYLVPLAANLCTQALDGFQPT